jgi:hypothetical protein
MAAYREGESADSIFRSFSDPVSVEAYACFGTRFCRLLLEIRPQWSEISNMGLFRLILLLFLKYFRSGQAKGQTVWTDRTFLIENVFSALLLVIAGPLLPTSFESQISQDLSRENYARPPAVWRRTRPLTSPSWCPQMKWRR